MAPRIYADFNGLTASPRQPSRSMVPLDTWGSLRDLSNAGIRLREGLELVIHDASDELEDLEAEAIAYYDPKRRWWYAELVRGYADVPARDRTPDVRFLCLGCRRDLGGTESRPVSCPACGLSVLAAITPPTP